MNHLIIYANYNDGSFNHAVRDNLESTYRSIGHQVTVRDLYAMQFNPVLTSDDFENLRAGKLPDEIITEQNYITNADVLTFVYPVWWTGMPAILKGYIDRVFLYGFAYKRGPNGVEGMLQGKKVLLFSSTGNPKKDYEGGMYDAMNLTTNTGIFEYCGMTVLDHVYFPSVLTVPEMVRAQYIEDSIRLVEKLFGDSSGGIKH